MTVQQTSMQEVKFRVWDKRYRNWKSPCNVAIDGTGTMWWLFGFDAPTPLEKDDLIIELFTGLKDKNGTEIYEGDLVCFHNGYHLEFPERPSQVIFENGAFKNCKSMPTNEAITLRPVVLGNIHENPELIK